MDPDSFQLIRPPINLIDEIKVLIKENNLSQYEREIDYHFNIGKWTVNLADTKRSMINYDFSDLVNSFQATVPREKKETNRDYFERQKKLTESLQSKFITLYQQFREYVLKQLHDKAEKMNYYDLFNLFKATWGKAPFKLNYLLEDMFLLLGDESVMQNVVGNSGSFKSTRSMIEFNSLPSVLIIDDITIAGISRDSQTKGINYLNNTVVYYNDVGDTAQMQQNFKDVLQSVYKKLYSEGMISRTLSMKNSDKTLHLNLRTPNGFKIKFNSVRPIFSEDDGQTASRTMIINLPAYTMEEAKQLILSGNFGEAVWSGKDPRIFKDILQAYYKTRTFEQFSKEYEAELAVRFMKDNNEESNFHLIHNGTYRHREMCKLYGEELYKEKYYNRVMINTSVKDLERQLYDVIKNGLDLSVWQREAIHNEFFLNELGKIAKTSSASAHKNEYNYDAFTIKAVKGIRQKFITNNSTKIATLLKMMEEHDLCAKVSKIDNGYNVYILIEQNKKD